MRSDSQYTVGIHTLMMVAFFQEDDINSRKVARSIGCNPVIVRNVFVKLSRAGLLKAGQGRKRAELARSPAEITLKDVFMATQSDDVDVMFKMYDPNPDCPIGKDIHCILSSRFENAKDAMLEEMSKTTIADLVAELPPEKNRLPENLRD